LKKGQLAQHSKMAEIEGKLDQIDQDKLKDDVVITGSFELTAPSPTTISTFVKNHCNSTVSPNSISSFYATKSNKNETILKLTITHKGERIGLLKNKKALAAKKIFVNEALTPQNYKLLLAAKGLCKEKKLLSTWTRGGRAFFAKKNDSATPIPILTHIQLAQL